MLKFEGELDVLQQIAEHEAVQATLNGYVDIVASGNAGFVPVVFHPQALISGYAFPPGGPPQGVFVVVPAVSGLIEYLKTARPVKETSPRYRARIAAIEVIGTLATATILEESLEGRDFVSHFHLHRVEDKWLITSKSMSSVPARN